MILSKEREENQQRFQLRKRSKRLIGKREPNQLNQKWKFLDKKEKKQKKPKN